jgi:hypothetical protein
MPIAFTPYRPMNPADPTSFVGRDEVLDGMTTLMERSCAGQISDIQILGQRGLGKTSTLLKIRSMATKGCMTVYVLGRKCDKTEFVDEILQAVEREHRDLGKGSISFVDLASALRRGEKSGVSVLIEALSLLGSLPIFVLLDDTDFVTPETLVELKSAFSQLRSAHRKPACLVLASETSLSDALIKSGLSSSEAFLFSFYLKNLSSEEVTALLLRAYAKWTKKSIHHVYSKTKGHPALVQMYGAAYHELAESDDRLKFAETEIPKGKIPDETSGWREWGSFFLYTGLELSKRAFFEQMSDEVVLKCDNPVKNAFFQWYANGWTQKPSKAEWNTVLTIARLGGSARFIDIKRSYGRNPAPQLKRAVIKRMIERRERGVYSIPHPLITEALQDKYFAKKR